MRKIFPIAILVLLFVCHFPFLTADPDVITDIHTRGAWTDEGLYTSQVRNFLIDGDFNVKENSTFMRGPAFNLLQLPFFYVLGSHRLVSRLLVLLSTFLVILLFLRLKGFETMVFFLVLLGFAQLHIFHFSHYGLAEMAAVSMILLGLYFLLQAQVEKALSGYRNGYILLSAFAFFLAYAMKIQFLYVAGILPLTLFIVAILTDKEREAAFQLFGVSLIFTAVFMAVYAGWYYINQDFYHYIMAHEAAGRYPSGVWNLFSGARWNFRYFLWVRELQPLLYAVIPSVLVILWQRYRGITNKRQLVLWIFTLVWLGTELHKLPMTYLPNRYLLSLFFAMALLVAQALAGLYERGRVYMLISLLLGALFVGLSLPFHYKIWKNRTYQLSVLNQYLSKHSFDGRYGLGSWAAAASWDTDLRTIPVWKDYFNAGDPVNTFHPALIITEKDESESDYTYTTQDIDLQAISDSSRSFSIWRYKVVVWWIKDQNFTKGPVLQQLPPE